MGQGAEWAVWVRPYGVWGAPVSIGPVGQCGPYGAGGGSQVSTNPIGQRGPCGSDPMGQGGALWVRPYGEGGGPTGQH